MIESLNHGADWIMDLAIINPGHTFIRRHTFIHPFIRASTKIMTNIVWPSFKIGFKRYKNVEKLITIKTTQSNYAASNLLLWKKSSPNSKDVKSFKDVLITL